MNYNENFIQRYFRLRTEKTLFQLKNKAQNWACLAIVGGQFKSNKDWSKFYNEGASDSNELFATTYIEACVHEFLLKNKTNNELEQKFPSPESQKFSALCHDIKFFILAISKLNEKHFEQAVKKIIIKTKQQINDFPPIFCSENEFNEKFNYFIVNESNKRLPPNYANIVNRLTNSINFSNIKKTI